MTALIDNIEALNVIKHYTRNEIQPLNPSYIRICNIKQQLENNNLIYTTQQIKNYLDGLNFLRNVQPNRAVFPDLTTLPYDDAYTLRPNIIGYDYIRLYNAWLNE